MIDLISMAGMICVLLAFILNVLEKLSIESTTYLVLNILGCLLLGYYSIVLASVPFIIINAVWLLVSLYKLVQKLVQIRAKNCIYVLTRDLPGMKAGTIVEKDLFYNGEPVILEDHPEYFKRKRK